VRHAGHVARRVQVGDGRLAALVDPELLARCSILRDLYRAQWIACGGGRTGRKSGMHSLFFYEVVAATVAEAAAVAEGFAQSDPYVLGGLVPSWRVRKWPTVAGRDAAAPLSSASFR
jgi:uncharacterized protein YciI